MRVWIVNHYVPVPVRGFGNRHYALARRLIEKGHDVTVVASSFAHGTRTRTHPYDGRSWRLDVEEGVPFVWVHTPPYSGNGLARIWNMLCFAYRVIEGAPSWRLKTPDVIVGSSPHLFAALSAQRLAARYRIPFVLEIRDLWPQSLVELGGFSRRNPAIHVLDRIERVLYRQADAIVSLLPGAVGYMVQKGAAADKIAWIPNGVDLSAIALPRPPKPRSEFVVIYAGAHGRANGLDSIMDAAAILQREGLQGKLRFRFIGDGPEKPRLERRALREGLEIVSFEPPMPRCDIYRVLSEADAFVATLRKADLYRYGISLNKLYDYLAAARPVVFGARSFNDPVSEAHAGLTVPPEDPQAMATALRQLIDMPRDERWQMGLRGRRYVEKHHDYAHLAERLERVISEAQARSRTTRGRRS